MRFVVIVECEGCYQEHDCGNSKGVDGSFHRCLSLREPFFMFLRDVVYRLLKDFDQIQHLLFNINATGEIKIYITFRIREGLAFVCPTFDFIIHTIFKATIPL